MYRDLIKELHSDSAYIVSITGLDYSKHEGFNFLFQFLFFIFLNLSNHKIVNSFTNQVKNTLTCSSAMLRIGNHASSSRRDCCSEITLGMEVLSVSVNLEDELVQISLTL